MSVPFQFASTPGGSSIPLVELDTNFNYLTNGTPQFTNLSLSGNLSVVGNASVSGNLTVNGTFTFDGILVSGVSGTGPVVLQNGATLVNPNLGTPTAVTLTNGIGLPISTGVSGLGTNVATFLAGPSSTNLLAAMTDATGTGQLVFNINPTLLAADLGTPVAGVLTNCGGLPLTSGVVGLLPIANGGTNANTAAAAANNLLPQQSSGQNGYVLTTDGAGNLSWTPSSGSVTSVNASGGTTGFTFSGGPITSAGTLTLGGSLDISAGGTGAITQQSAINNLAGVATSGFFLRGNGTNVLMSAIQVSDVPTLNQNTSGSAQFFYSTTQNSQFNSVGIGEAASATPGNLRTSGPISAGTTITAGGSIGSASSINAGTSLSATTSLTVGTNITAGGAITATGNITGNQIISASGIIFPLLNDTTTTANVPLLSFTVPSWAKRVTFMLKGVSCAGTSNKQFQIGVSSGIISSGYIGYAFDSSGTGVPSSTGFIFNSTSATDVLSGFVAFNLLDSTTNTWVYAGTLSDSFNNNGWFMSGSVSLAGPLTTVNLSSVTITDSFTAGIVNVIYG